MHSDFGRFHHARQVVGNERDHLVKAAELNLAKTGMKKKLRSDTRDRAKVIAWTFVLTFGTLLPYALILHTWFYVYHKSLANFMLTLILVLFVALLCICSSNKRYIGKEYSWLWWLGMMVTQATVVATVIGFVLYFQYLAYYWKHEEMRSYTNVAAAQDARAFSDGSMFLFTEDTRLDPMRAVGYQSRWTGQTYCVAPIVDSTMSNADDIYYWAVGTNCCSPRAEFHCDDAADFSTRSALVVLEPEDVVRPFMRWAVQGAAYPLYQGAVKLQEDTYFTKAARQPKLVRWSRDPIALKNEYLLVARKKATWFSIFYGVLVFCSAAVVGHRIVYAKKSEDVVLCS